MSGIAGIVRLDGASVRPRSMDTLLAAMHHRGPHRAATWSAGSVALGYCALHSTPEAEREQQPLIRDHLVVVADARLDYRRDLKRALGIEPRIDATDVELIVAAFEKWGDECPNYLEGDFAFAIWDTKRRRLFCARDHFGVRPLVYYHSDTMFAFASDVGALLAMEGVPSVVNDVRIADFLVGYLEGFDEESTFYRHILRMPPASTMTVARGAISLSRYWYLESQQPLALASDDDYTRLFAEVFHTAVTERLRGVGPASAMLSGGMDSSAIVAVARDTLGPDALHTYSAVVDDPSDIETRCSSAVISQGGLCAHRIYPEDQVGQLEVHRAMSRLLHDPFDLTMTVPHAMYIAAMQHGARYLLDGIPGDNLLSMKSSVISHRLRQGKPISAFREAVAMKRAYGAEAEDPRWAIARRLPGALAPVKLRAFAHQQWTFPRLADEWMSASNMTSGLARSTRTRERIIDVLAREHRHSVSESLVDPTHTLRSPRMTAAIERYGRLASSAGIEARHPFLDRRLVTLCSRLPWHQKTRDAVDKRILRRALGKRLPPLVLERHEYAHPTFQFTESAVRLHLEDIRQLLARPESPVFDYVDRRGLSACLRTWEGTAKAYPESWNLWQTWILGSWLGTA